MTNYRSGHKLNKNYQDPSLCLIYVAGNNLCHPHKTQNLADLMLNKKTKRGTHSR